MHIILFLLPDYAYVPTQHGPISEDDCSHLSTTGAMYRCYEKGLVIKSSNSTANLNDIPWWYDRYPTETNQLGLTAIPRRSLSS